MKKILLTLISIMTTVVAGAQVVNIYEDDCYKETYTNGTHKYNVVLGEYECDASDYVQITNTDGTTTIWATKNIGATTVSESPQTAYGDYYAFGANQTWYKDGFISWSSSTSGTIGGWKSGYTDGYTVANQPTITGTTLSSAQDIATIRLGNKWRMPTPTEYNNLIDACRGSQIGTITSSTTTLPTTQGIYWCDGTETTTYKVPGMLFIDSKGAKLFIPAAGLIDPMTITNAGSRGYYFTSSKTDDSNASGLRFASSSIFVSSTLGSRCGFSIRPVCTSTDVPKVPTIYIYEDGVLKATYKKGAHTYRVTLGKEFVNVSGITLNKTATELYLGSTSTTLTATIAPVTATNKNIIWTSSNEAVATVDKYGVVSPVTEGAATITATATDGSGISATCVVTVVNHTLLSGEFSVSANKKVQFTKGNLYWNGSAFKLEENQTDYPTSWSKSHIGHFFWIKYADYAIGFTPYNQSYYYASENLEDKLWCSVSTPLTIDDTSGLYAMTNDEWEYLIKNRRNANSLCKYGVTVTNGGTTYKNCVIIAPDDFIGELLSSYTLEDVNAACLVCLPAAGFRNGDYTLSDTSLKGCGSSGYYWVDTPSSQDEHKACNMCFYSNEINTNNFNYRYFGYALRLVQTIQK